MMPQKQRCSRVAIWLKMRYSNAQLFCNLFKETSTVANQNHSHVLSIGCTGVYSSACIYLSVCLPVSLCLCLPPSVSLSLSVCLSPCLSICLCLSVCLSLSACSNLRERRRRHFAL